MTSSACAIAASPEADAKPFLPPLDHPPLDLPLDITGGFCEYRIGHFHAGLDFGTGRRVGRSVYAPLPGYVERVRASGVGYGRSIYLRGRDGRLLQFGHLDAFEEPLASFVAAAQESAGQYEQDLWPEAGRFAVKAGQRIAWTGESGAGGPHMHFEIRRGDMAYHPLRAGLSAPDTSAPTLVSLTLEPLDDRSFVERSAAPFTVRLSAKAETVLVEGRVRAVVGARDGIWQGVDRMMPWSVALECQEEWVECRFDSVSWATDMVESDYLYDSGRVVGQRGVLMWAPAGFRPRVLLTSAPLGRDAGTLEVRPRDPPRELTLVARDVAGNRTTRVVVLRAPRPGELGPDTLTTGPPGPGPAADARLELASLPGDYIRVSDRGARGLRGVRIGLRGTGFEISRPAVWRNGRWTAILLLPKKGGESFSVMISGNGIDTRIEQELGAFATAGSVRNAGQEWDWDVPGDAAFDGARVLIRDGRVSLPKVPVTPRELVRAGPTQWIGPAVLPLHTPIRLQRSVVGVVDAKRADIYRWDGEEWNRLGATLAPDKSRLQAETRRLGTFAVFTDTLAPRITRQKPARAVTSRPYNRWALEARLTEQGSGVDARASYLVVDGARVPSEWDSEAGVLRWRPRRAPQSGSHRYQVVATDRAGNITRASGTFVLD